MATLLAGAGDWAVTVEVRDAVEGDLSAILAIYNQVVATTSAIWRDEPASPVEWAAWFRDRRAQAMPVLVASDHDGEAPEVVAYASFQPFRSLPGYVSTVEHSVHVRDSHRGQGIGKLLLQELVLRARLLDKSVMIAGSDGANDGSIRFHEKAGFREVARLPGVGRRQGRPRDLVLLQLDLAAEPDEATPSDGSAGRGLIRGLDHVQLAMPVGREADAVGFYAGLLGIRHVPKPPRLAARGGCWFEDGDVKVHLGVDSDFRPARKAHPALTVHDLPALLARLRQYGVAVVQDDPVGNRTSAYVDDPFGNRLELIEQ